MCDTDHLVDWSIPGILIVIFTHVCVDCDRRFAYNRAKIKVAFAQQHPGVTVTTVERYYKEKQPRRT